MLPSTRFPLLFVLQIKHTSLFLTNFQLSQLSDGISHTTTDTMAEYNSSKMTRRNCRNTSRGRRESELVERSGFNGEGNLRVHSSGKESWIYLQLEFAYENKIIESEIQTPYAIRQSKLVQCC